MRSAKRHEKNSDSLPEEEDLERDESYVNEEEDNVADVADDDDDDDNQETVGLISNTTNPVNSNNDANSSLASSSKISNTTKYNIIFYMVELSMIMIIATFFFLSSRHDEADSSSSSSFPEALHITCPAPLDGDISENNADIGDYISQGHGIKTMNPTEIWDMWHTDSIDHWNINYTEFLCRNRKNKQQAYSPYMIGSSPQTHQPRPSDNNSEENSSSPPKLIRIYESACGTGRNLAGTIDLILGEQMSKISNPIVVEVYGNDYVSDSAVAARTFFQSADDIMFKSTTTHNENKVKIQLGSICGGVSSIDLHHVPSDSFDVVFTGYLAPLHDPLNFQATKYPNSTRKEISQVYEKLCRHGNPKNKKHYNPKAQSDVEVFQGIQEDWFAKWAGEMIRIAKPGAPIIFEYTSLPKCVQPKDTGGVSKEFWISATKTKKYLTQYNWDQIDPTSIHFEHSLYCDGTESRHGRYIVSMVKKTKE